MKKNSRPASPPPSKKTSEAPLLTAPSTTFFLGGMFLIVFLAAIHAASEIVIPIVFAFVLKLVLQPVMRLLGKTHLPRTLAAYFIVVVLIGGMGILATILSGPAISWAEKMPDSFPVLQERFGSLGDPIDGVKRLVLHAENMMQGDGVKAMAVTVQGNRLSDHLLIGTQAFASFLFTTAVVLFFLLVSGDRFMHRLVETLPRFEDKRQAVDIFQRIQHDISAYLLTVTLMNAFVGVTTGVAMSLCGQGDAVLWGTLAFLLNYVPILGPMIGIMIFLFVGLLSTPVLSAAILPAAIYLCIHLIEGTLITPLLLARRFILNPALVILSLLFWYWMWGLPGAILAMPMLAAVKIICDRIESLKAFGHFLEG